MEYCFSGTPNALDFQISTRIGSLLKESLMYEDTWEAQNMLTFGSLPDARKSIKVIIISEDKGYYPLVEYWVARGYNVAIRNSICGEDADVKGYLRELSISKQLETQQAYLEKSGLTISEASKEMPEIKIPNKDAKTKGSGNGAVTEHEKTEVLVSVFKDMLAEFQKSEETRLSKLINDRCVMKEDITKYEKLKKPKMPKKTKSEIRFIVNIEYCIKHGINKKKARAIASYALGNGDKIGELYDSSLTDKKNVEMMKAHGLDISVSTLKRWREKNGKTKYKKRQ